ncbi:MAG: hypothetical protein PHV85_08050, partial [Desulfovibrionaceae bacterium]|nr:hypothetical protein [Desulfovibrionaceae bacterium]
LNAEGLACEVVLKVNEGRPNVVDRIKNREIDLVINTPSGKKTKYDAKALRQAALLYGIPYATTLAGARAMGLAIKERRAFGLSVRCLQDY